MMPQFNFPRILSALAFHTLRQVDKVREQPNDEYGQHHAENDYQGAHAKTVEEGRGLSNTAFA